MLLKRLLKTLMVQPPVVKDNPFKMWARLDEMRITINKDYISTAILCSSITAGIEHGKIRHGGTFILSILKCFFFAQLFCYIFSDDRIQCECQLILWKQINRQPSIIIDGCKLISNTTNASPLSLKYFDWHCSISKTSTELNNVWNVFSGGNGGGGMTSMFDGNRVREGTHVPQNPDADAARNE